MPNNVADPNDAVFGTDANGNPYVQRLNPPVAGRWGEADSVSGGIDAPNAPNQINGYVNLVQDSFTNPVRAGYSFGIADLLNGDAPCRSRRQLQPVRPLSDRSHRRGQRSRLLRLRRWSDAARRPDAPVRHTGRHRRIGPGAALGRPLARGRRRGRRRRGRCVRAGRLRRLLPAPRRPGAHQRRTRRRGGTRHDRLSLGPRPLLHQRPQPGQSDIPVVPARRHQQPAPRLRGGQEPEPPRRLCAPGQRRHARR